MGDRDLTDLTNVLLTAAGAGLALAFGYLVMKPATRTMRRYLGATLVALPGLLLGVALADPHLGARSAYGGLTDALLGSSNPFDDALTPAPPEVGGRTSPATGGSAAAENEPTLAPSSDAFITGSPDSQGDPDDIGSSVPPVLSTTAATDPAPTETTTSTDPPPPPTDTTTDTTTEPPPPTDTTTEPPPPTDTTTEPPPPPPSPTETSPPPTTEPPPPPPPPEPSPSDPIPS